MLRVVGLISSGVLKLKFVFRTCTSFQNWYRNFSKLVVARYVIFTSPDIHLSMVNYTTVVDPWFHTVADCNFATTTALLDWLQAGVRISFMKKASQSADTPHNLKEQYLK